MFYWITNAVAIAIILILFFLSFMMEKFSFRRLSIKNIALISVLVAISVVLTNVIGYSRIFGFQIMIGNVMIFLAGMIFGPLAGIFAGFCSDITGTFINISGTFHAGFMLSKIVIGFAGSLVFMFRKNNFWYLRVVLFLILGLTITSFVINPICLSTIMGPSLAKVNFIRKLIIVPIELLIFIPTIFYTTEVINLLLKTDYNKPTRPWFLKNGQLKYKKQKNS